MTTRRRFSPIEKAQIVMETLLPKANVAEIRRTHGVRSSQVYERKRAALAGRHRALTGSASPDAALRAENVRLKKLVVESALVINRLQETLGGNSAGRNDGGSS